eukprot:Gregarina_sp_Poly_1__2060@NODE_1542_length_3881_cov_191_814106_g1017_i0_p2_GENE_NODE_1542_length_3881_cov_191_814106_g1017_i0NODE_1542_length_3881_cov_191_814106_g1017_i0_p2_ORF_typecomplete_len420_score35_88Tfb2/PF03849_14/3e26_NODE_1542_length_3881_cov_191_814106_g1017_i0341260
MSSVTTLATQRGFSTPPAGSIPAPLLETRSEPLHGRLNEVLRDASPEIVSSLFQNEAVVRLVLSGLSPSAKLLLSRLIPLTQAAPYQPLLAWYAGNHALLRATIAALRRVKVVSLQQLIAPQTSQTTAASRSDAGGSAVSASGGPTKTPPKHQVHKEFRTTYLSLITKEPRPERFSSFVQLSSAEKDSLEAPDGCALQTCAQKNWSNLLGFLFCSNVKLPVTTGIQVDKSVTPPGPALLEVLNLKQLVYTQETVPGVYQPPPDKHKPKIPRAAFHWLLSDLSEQLSALLFAFVDGVSHGLIKSANCTNEPPVLSGAKCFSILCEIAEAKFGEPLPLKNDIGLLEERFISLCHELGVIVTGTSFINGKTHKVVYPTPLVRIMVLSHAHRETLGPCPKCSGSRHIKIGSF